MDEDLRNTINKVFPKSDIPIVEELLKIINKDLSEKNKRNRINELDGILNKVTE